MKESDRERELGMEQRCLKSSAAEVGQSDKSQGRVRQ